LVTLLTSRYTGTGTVCLLTVEKLWLEFRIRGIFHKTYQYPDQNFLSGYNKSLSEYVLPVPQKKINIV
jgi:hypothetical protein